MTIGRTHTNPIPAGRGGQVLGNSLIRAHIRGDRTALAITVLSLVDQTGPDNTAAVASTLTSLTVTAANALVTAFGRDDALIYLESLDTSAQFAAVVNDITA
jgi:hypothetical protein